MITQLNNIDFILGDAIEEMKKLPSDSIDLVLTDLPYGITRNKWDEIIPLQPMWKELNRITKERAAMVFFAAQPFATLLIESNPKQFRYDLIWKKNKATGFLNANRMPLRSHEHILVFYKKLPTYNPQKTTGHQRKVSTKEHKRNSKYSTNYNTHKLTTYDSTERYPTSVLEFPVVNNDDPDKIHPTQKPLELCDYLIKTYSNPNDLVLDPTAGSGTTLISAERLGRRSIGVEMNEEYYHETIERIYRHFPELQPQHL